MNMDSELTDACKRLAKAIDATKKTDAPIITKKGQTLYIVNRSELENMREFDRMISTRG